MKKEKQDNLISFQLKKKEINGTYQCRSKTQKIKTNGVKKYIYIILSFFFADPYG